LDFGRNEDWICLPRKLHRYGSWMNINTGIFKFFFLFYSEDVLENYV
jgi:hypothetical protein